MAIDEGLCSLFRTHAAITALLGGSSSDHIVIDKIDQSHTPSYISVSVLNTDYMHMLQRTEGIRSSTLDMDCVSTTQEKSNQLADVLEEFLMNYSGVAGVHTIYEVHLNDRSGDSWPLGQGSQKYKFVTTVNADVVFA